MVTQLKKSFPNLSAASQITALKTARISRQQDRRGSTASPLFTGRRKPFSSGACTPQSPRKPTKAKTARAARPQPRAGGVGSRDWERGRARLRHQLAAPEAAPPRARLPAPPHTPPREGEAETPARAGARHRARRPGPAADPRRRPPRGRRGPDNCARQAAAASRRRESRGPAGGWARPPAPLEERESRGEGPAPPPRGPPGRSRPSRGRDGGRPGPRTRLAGAARGSRPRRTHLGAGAGGPQAGPTPQRRPSETGARSPETRPARGAQALPGGGAGACRRPAAAPVFPEPAADQLQSIPRGLDASEEATQREALLPKSRCEKLHVEHLKVGEGRGRLCGDSVPGDRGGSGREGTGQSQNPEGSERKRCTTAELDSGEESSSDPFKWFEKQEAEREDSGPPGEPERGEDASTLCRGLKKTRTDQNL
ncbi:collagen alpha-1(I) chain-like [Orcinus orca]|uniref:collagen alpha-1(I) chain-like n=1 Tax=Orcinus orca TaxID=9733 RepID=UPI0021113FEA|nr:collagen alpha-1(I) chain-like [Orcinus orca]